MAVQQNRKTRSKRGMRRAHDAIVGPRSPLMRPRARPVVVTT